MAEKKSKRSFGIGYRAALCGLTSVALAASLWAYTLMKPVKPVDIPDNPNPPIEDVVDNPAGTVDDIYTEYLENDMAISNPSIGEFSDQELTIRVVANQETGKYQLEVNRIVDVQANGVESGNYKTMTMVVDITKDELNKLKEDQNELVNIIDSHKDDFKTLPYVTAASKEMSDAIVDFAKSDELFVSSLESEDIEFDFSTAEVLFNQYQENLSQSVTNAIVDGTSYIRCSVNLEDCDGNLCTVAFASEALEDAKEKKEKKDAIKSGNLDGMTIDIESSIEKTNQLTENIILNYKGQFEEVKNAEGKVIGYVFTENAAPTIEEEISK